MAKNKLETKYSQKAGSQGGGKVSTVQLGKMQEHGRGLKSPHPDRFLKGSHSGSLKNRPADE
jgi:hypothetical protein